MVNKKLKVERPAHFHCVPFMKRIQEGNSSESEPMILNDCSMCLKNEMCKKKQKLVKHEKLFAFHLVEQDECLLNSLIPQDFNNHQYPPEACTLTTNFGDYFQGIGKRAEIDENVAHNNIGVDVNSSSSNHTALHIAAMHNHTKLVEYLLLHRCANVDDPDPKGRTALHLAAVHRNVAAVELLLKHGANPCAKSHEGLSSMFFAVQSGCVSLVELLASHGCDVNEWVVDSDLNRQYSHLHSAVERNHAKMVESLLRWGADVNKRDSFGSTALHLASRDGRLDIARLLLHRGARVHERDRGQLTALFHAVDAGHEALFQLLLRYGANPTDRGPAGASLLHLAVKRGDLDFLTALLHQGVDVNAATRFGKTALHYAVAEKNWCALQLLLQNGADPNRAEALGKTPLHSAVEARRTEAFGLLLLHGADANARDAARQTPLHAAVKQGCLFSVRTLLHHGAEVDARDAARQTPLHLAARLGHLELFEPLTGHRADIDAADAQGQTALHLAIASEHAKLLYLRPDHTFFARLLRHGADVRGRTRSGGQTPLHLAVRCRCRAFARGLLRRGAQVDAEDADLRRTPLHVAAENGDAECTDELLVFGADPGRVDSSGHRALELAASSEVKLALARYATRQRIAGLRVSSSLRGIENEAEPEYAHACAQEVKRMASSRLCVEATYFGFLKASRRSLVMLVKKSVVVEAFEQQQQRKTFPLYADMLERNLGVGLLYEPLLKEASDRLTMLLGTRLPSVPLERVLDYLDARDMKCLLEAMPSPKFRKTETLTAYPCLL